MATPLLEAARSRSRQRARSLCLEWLAFATFPVSALWLILATQVAVRERAGYKRKERILRIVRNFGAGARTHTHTRGALPKARMGWAAVNDGMDFGEGFLDSWTLELLG